MIFYEFCSFDKPFYSNACNLLSLYLQFKGDFKENSEGLLFRIVLNRAPNVVVAWYRHDWKAFHSQNPPKSSKLLTIVINFPGEVIGRYSPKTTNSLIKIQVFPILMCVRISTLGRCQLGGETHYI